MTKIKKIKRSKKYRYSLNRKRMNKRRLPVLESNTVKHVWNPHTSCQKNFKRLGLVFDINEDIKRMNRESKITGGSSESEKTYSTSLVNYLEQNAEIAVNKKNFRFSQDQVNYIIYLLKKYGEDYKAMSRDKKNYLQLSWKQIRQKIKLFKSISAHYREYLISLEE